MRILTFDVRGLWLRAARVPLSPPLQIASAFALRVAANRAFAQLGGAHATNRFGRELKICFASRKKHTACLAAHDAVQTKARRVVVAASSREQLDAVCAEVEGVEVSLDEAVAQTEEELARVATIYQIKGAELSASTVEESVVSRIAARAV